MRQALYLRSLQGCFTINDDWSSLSLSKMKVNGTDFIVHFLLQWSFLNVKIHLFFVVVDKFDVLYA